MSKELYTDTPAPITVRTGRLGGYEAHREVGMAPAAQRAQEEFARAAEARERAAEQARAKFLRICAAHSVPVCAADASRSRFLVSLLAPEPKARMRAR